MTRTRARVALVGHGVRHLGRALRALAVLALALAVLAPVQVMTAEGAGAATRTLRDPFSREVVRRGDVDRGPYHIEHVYEVQRRLKRLGLFDVQPTGAFGPITEAAVKAFQKESGLPVTGRVGHRTWRPLIKQSVRGRGGVPAGCRSAGWHACYDPRWHQVNPYHKGTLLNSWLVRGERRPRRPAPGSSGCTTATSTTSAASTTRRCPTRSSSRAGRRCTGRG